MVCGSWYLRWPRSIVLVNSSPSVLERSILRSPDPALNASLVAGASMEKVQFDKFRQLVHQLSGIHLADNKEALVIARISKRMRTLGIADYGAYYNFVLGDKSGAELTQLINAISTNVTHFFREPRHFELLGKWVRDWEQEGRKNIRIWSAASSTGEEPYTIAMTLLESCTRSTKFEIIASDISTRVLEAARTGIYRRQDIEKIPHALLRKYFQVGGNEDELFRVKPALSDMVSYKQINLSTPPYPVQGDLDLIFCKNVMIYFTQQLRKQIVTEFQKMLRPGGYLIVGMAESLSASRHELQTIEPSVYRKP
jgi:chemotaxis protein methyltransferase CheR